ncbi:MAG: phospholipase/carboxylesterase [Chloroflexi bacterium OLB13]|nr:MAG: phospholipase/carboxylesterase [Chloroflexi bacterium OLB13]
MGAVVDKRIYPGMGHTINQDEIDAASALLSAIGTT